MIVGVSGLAGSGKDTVADRLVDKHNFAKIGLADPLKRFCMEAYDFSFQQLWGPSEWRNKPDERYPRDHTYNRELLEDAKCVCCGWDSSVGSLKVPQCYLTPRYALQMLGTEWGRGCYDKTWIEYGLREATRLMGSINAYSAKRGTHVANQYCTGRGHGDDRSPCFFDVRGVVFSDFRFKNEIYPAKARGVKLWRTLRGDGKPKFDHPSETEQLEIPDDVFHNRIDNKAPLVDPETGELLEPGMPKEELYQIVDDLVAGLPW